MGTLHYTTGGGLDVVTVTTAGPQARSQGRGGRTTPPR